MAYHYPSLRRNCVDLSCVLEERRAVADKPQLSPSFVVPVRGRTFPWAQGVFKSHDDQEPS